MKKFLVLLSFLSVVFVSCNMGTTQQKSDSGVSKATVQIKTGIDGLTAEQRNITRRLTKDNEPGSIKHLYIVSAYTGEVLQYSTVDGKITSGGKRLSPKTVNGNGYNNQGYSNYVVLHGNSYTTDEVLDDGGTYGESGAYLYWFDAQGNYQQYYPSGGTYVQISDRPLRMKKSTLSLELMEELPAIKK